MFEKQNAGLDSMNQITSFSRGWIRGLKKYRLNALLNRKFVVSETR
jgi:hypothetical protein